MLDEPLGLLQNHFRHLHVPGRRLIESGTNHLSLDGTLHIRHFLGTLVNQQDNQGDFRVIAGDGIGNALQEHRLAGARRRNDQAALTLTDGRQQVEHARRDVVLDRLQVNALLGIERREVVKEEFVAGFIGGLKIDRLDFDEREVPLPLFGWSDLAGNRIAGAQIEFADLGWRYVDVVRPGQVVVIRRAQESETVRKALKNALGEDEAALFGLCLQDLEDQFLLAHPGCPHHAQVFGHLGQGDDVHFFQLGDVEDFAFL